MTIPTIVHHESFAVILYQWTNNNGEIEMTILTILLFISVISIVTLYQQRNNNGWIEMSSLTIVHIVIEETLYR